jgi:hypothetical protein
MKKRDKEWLLRAIHMMGQNAVFMYECGKEKDSWNWLFLREFYKDLLEKK